MRRKNIPRQKRISKELHIAQEGKCFHCDKPIDYKPGKEHHQETKATKDHVFCRTHRMKYTSFGWFFVLSCYQCNWNRKDTPLSQEQVYKAMDLWIKIKRIPTLDIPVFFKVYDKSII